MTRVVLSQEHIEAGQRRWREVIEGVELLAPSTLSEAIEHAGVEKVNEVIGIDDEAMSQAMLSFAKFRLNAPPDTPDHIVGLALLANAVAMDAVMGYLFGLQQGVLVERERSMEQGAPAPPVTPQAARSIVRAAENYNERMPAEQGSADQHEAMDWLRELAAQD